MTESLDMLLRREADRLGRSASEVARIALAEFFANPPHERAQRLDGSPDIAEIERILLG